MKNARFFHSSALFPLALLGLLLGMTRPARAQEDNLMRLRECARIIADSVAADLGSDTICVAIVNHQAGWLLDQAVISAGEERKIPIRICDSTHPAEATLAITSLGVFYQELDDDDDAIGRLAQLEVSATLPRRAGGNAGRTVRIYSVALRDTVPADGTSLIERSGYEFARGSFPASNGGGFWKKLVEPAVVLGATVIMVVLLFTVRSR